MPRLGLQQQNVRAASALRPVVSSPPERVRLALDATISFRDRVDAVHAIRTPLTDTERDAVYRYLRSPANNPQNRVGEDWLRNEIMDKLVQHDRLIEALA